jgi:hypothetical protein
MNRRGWTRKIIDGVDFDEEWKTDVMPHEFEARMIVEVCDVGLAARE